jgi:hypothetical protein
VRIDRVQQGVGSKSEVSEDSLVVRGNGGHTKCLLYQLVQGLGSVQGSGSGAKVEGDKMLVGVGARVKEWCNSPGCKGQGLVVAAMAKDHTHASS